jgi:hypothetical protein
VSEEAGRGLGSARVAGVALLACLAVVASPCVFSDAQPSFPRAAPPLSASALGAVDLAGSVMHLRLDDAAGRVFVSTVRYPGGGLRRDELHLYDLGGAGRPGGPAHRLTRDIDDVESVALSRDGERIAVGCAAGVCIHRWGAEAVERQLAAPGKRRELGSLAFRPDLLVAAQRQRMEIVAWELGDGGQRQWAVASAGERFREGLTPRLHGRPLWAPRWVGISPDGRRIAAIRDDGTVSLWGRAGEAVKSLRGPPLADMDPAFAPDGRLVVLHALDGRISAVDAESEHVLLSVEDRARHSVRRAALLFGALGSYLATAGPDGVVLHALPSGAVATTLPAPDAVWRIAISGDGRVVAVATQHRVHFWSVAPKP